MEYMVGFVVSLAITVLMYQLYSPWTRLLAAEKAKEDADRSYVYESASLQIGRMVYNIHADPNDIANFYIQECPAAGWKVGQTQLIWGHSAQAQPDRRYPKEYGCPESPATLSAQRRVPARTGWRSPIFDWL